MRTLTQASLIFLFACQSGPSARSGLWDIGRAVSTGDTLWIPLPSPGTLAMLGADGSSSILDTGAWRTDQIQSAPVGDRLLLWQSAQRCEGSESRRKPVYVEDCDGRLRTEGRLQVRQGSELIGSTPLSPVFGAPVFSDDGRWAVATVDPQAVLNQGLGIVNLDALLLIDLESGTASQIPVGFETTKTYFLPDAQGQAAGLLLLSPSQVATVSLGEAPKVDVVYPLTLSISQVLHPVGAALTADASHALVSIAESSDLYTLDLVHPSINLVALSGRPAAMYADPVRDRSIIVYAGQSVVDIVDHKTFEVESIALEAPMTRIDRAADALLLTSGRTFGYRLDLETLDLVPLGFRGAPQARWVSEDGTWGVFATGSNQLEVVAVGPESAQAEAISSRALSLQSSIASLSFAPRGGGTAARILLQGQEQLFTLDLTQLTLETEELEAPALRLGALGDGTVWIAQDDALGLVSFLGADDQLTTVAGFAAEGAERDTLLLDAREP